MELELNKCSKSVNELYEIGVMETRKLRELLKRPLAY
jgi:hypothetical protein